MSKAVLIVLNTQSIMFQRAILAPGPHFPSPKECLSNAIQTPFKRHSNAVQRAFKESHTPKQRLEGRGYINAILLATH